MLPSVLGDRRQTLYCIAAISMGNVCRLLYGALSMYLCVSVLLCLFPCVSVSLCHCVSVSLHPCVSVSPCLCALLFAAVYLCALMYAAVCLCVPLYSLFRNLGRCRAGYGRGQERRHSERDEVSPPCASLPSPCPPPALPCPPPSALQVLPLLPGPRYLCGCPGRQQGRQQLPAPPGGGQGQARQAEHQPWQGRRVARTGDTCLTEPSFPAPASP